MDPTDIAVQLARMATALEAQAVQIERLCNSIDGDGKDVVGIRMKVDRLERLEATRSRVMWAWFPVIAALFLETVWRKITGK